MEKITKEILAGTGIILGLIASYLIGFNAGKEEREKFIKDPVIIYNDMRIKKMDNKGIYGIISEKELKWLIGFKNTYELMENKRGRK